METFLIFTSGNALVRLYTRFHAVHEDITATKTARAKRLTPDTSLRLHTDICVNIKIVLTDLIYCFGQTGRGATNFHVKNKCEKGMCEGK